MQNEMKLSRGQRVRLADIGLGVQPFGIDLTLSVGGLVLDTACFGLDGHRKLSDDRYMTFFNQPESPCGGVKQVNSNSFRFDLGRLPNSIETLVITLAIDGSGVMSSLGGCQAKLSSSPGIPTANFSFDGSLFASERAVMLIEIYRKDGQWRLSSVGQGFNGGLDALVKHFGGEIATSTSAPVEYHQKLMKVGVAAEENTSVSEINIDEKSRQKLLQEQFVAAVPETLTVGNISLRERLTAIDPMWATDVYWDVRQQCIDLGLLRVGRGRGGSVCRIKPASQEEPDSISVQSASIPGNPEKPHIIIKSGLERGLAAYKTGNFDTVLLEWGTLAEQGVASAQYNLAVLYYNGRGVNKNLDLAYQWFMRAAEIGHAKAQFNLANIFESGVGAHQNHLLAELWYRKAAKQGNADAQVSLGTLLYEGRGKEGNGEEAIKWFHKSAEQGKAAAQHALANIYKGGWGETNKNDAEFLRWSRLAAEQGYAPAQFQLGLAYRDGKVGHLPQDKVEALKWILLAAEQGVPEAQDELGRAYEYGDNEFQDMGSDLEADYSQALGKMGLGLEIDLGEAVKWYRLAANQGCLESVESLTEIYESGEYLPEDPDEAVQLLLKAAENGDVVAQFIMATKYDNGEEVPQDNVQAARWYEAAAEQHHPDAQMRLGFMYEQGIGVDMNFGDARYWYSQALEQNEYAHLGATNANAKMSAALNLGVLYANGYGVEQDYEEARRLWELSAEHGSQAQFYLGELYRLGLGVPANPKQSAFWYRKSAAQGHASAQLNLGLIYAEGQGVVLDNKEAVKWYRLAADQSEPNALKNLGAAYHYGLAVQQNLIAAFALYKHASLAGADIAIENLDSTKLSPAENKAVQKLANQMSEPDNLLKALDRFVKKSLKSSGQ